MKFYSVRESDMTNIADAIRAKTGKTDGLTLAQMGEEIINVPDPTELEEVTVPLNMADGDMVITPSDDKAISKTIVQKPATLVPENIAEGVDIAGIIGALAASGGGDSPHVFSTLNGYLRYQYSISSSKPEAREVTLPAGATVYGATCSHWNASGTSSTTIASVTGGIPDNFAGVSVTENADGSITVSSKFTFASGARYTARIWIMIVTYSLRGIYSTVKDGVLYIYADDTATTLNSYLGEPAIPAIVDLSNSHLDTINARAFYQWHESTEILLPPTVNTIGASAFYTYGDIVVDMTKHTFVPTILESGVFYTGSYGSREIRVPAALYDEWIAATNWSSLADYIVAV